MYIFCTNQIKFTVVPIHTINRSNIFKLNESKMKSKLEEEDEDSQHVHDHEYSHKPLVPS